MDGPQLNSVPIADRSETLPLVRCGAPQLPRYAIDRLESMDATLLHLLIHRPRRAAAQCGDSNDDADDEANNNRQTAVTFSTADKQPEGFSYQIAKRKRRGPRLTIFSEQFIKELEHQHGYRGMERMLRSKVGVVLQTVVFIVMVVFLGVTPLVKENALWDPVKGEKVQNFLPQTPYAFHFGMSVLIANLASYFVYGRVGVKDCWEVSQIFYISRVSIFYAIGECMELFTLLYIDSVSWKILNQLKLPVTAMLNYLFLKRKQSAIQCALISSTTVSILGYCLSVQASSNSSSMPSTAPIVSAFGIGIGLINVFIITFAGVIADHTYKQVDTPFLILVAQGRVSAFIFTLIGVIGYSIYTGQYVNFFEGWNTGVAVLAVWLLVKDWSVTFVLRNLDSVWKALGTTMGLCVTYILANVIISYRINPVALVFVFSVIINIVCYTLTKRGGKQSAESVCVSNYSSK